MSHPPYLWGPSAGDDLEDRFAPPAGFTRARVWPGSFGAFLRALPVLPKGTPVVDYRGVVRAYGSDPRIAAVVDLDVGTTDLQQCADAVLRLDAEWRYAAGERRVFYGEASGGALGYEDYLNGARAVPAGSRLLVQRGARPVPDSHGAFRAYLDEVFAWANTASLERSTTGVSLASIRPGDFFVKTDSPFGHAVMVLDVARDAQGSLALLLGQGYMPAQSFHVLHGPGSTAWFVLPPDAREIVAPFWKPLPAESLHRFTANAAGERAPSNHGVVAPCDGCLASWPTEDEPAALLVLLHGDDQPPKTLFAKWQPWAESRRIALFAPACPTANGCQGSFWRWNGPVEWLRSGVEQLAATHPLDRSRLWIVGWSGGASYIGWHTQELEETFAALVFHGGGIPPTHSECPQLPASVYFLVGDANPLHSLAADLRRHYDACGQTVEWNNLHGLAHDGEWNALGAEAARAILDWLATKVR